MFTLQPSVPTLQLAIYIRLDSDDSSEELESFASRLVSEVIDRALQRLSPSAKQQQSSDESSISSVSPPPSSTSTKVDYVTMC